MPGHSDKPSCSKNQAPSAIDSTVTENMTKASANRPCEEWEPGMPGCCAIAAGVHCCDSSWQSIPARGLHAQPVWPHYHQLSNRAASQRKGPGVTSPEPLVAGLGAPLSHGLQ